MRIRSFLVRCRCALVCLTLGSHAVYGLDPALALNQYSHHKWLYEDEVPDSISALAQSEDGSLWIGTRRGLAQFNGTRFVPWTSLETAKLPSLEIRSLFANKSDGLWIGTSNGLSNFKDGVLRNFGVQENLPAGPYVSVLKDHLGSVWVVCACVGGGRVFKRYGRGQFTEVTNLHGARTLYEDRRGVLWIANDRGLCQQANGKQLRCIASDNPGGVGDIAEDRNGKIVVIDSTTRTLLELVNENLKSLITGRRTAGPPTSWRLALDREGQLWIATLGQGIARLHNGVVESLTRRDGLSGDSVKAMFEDRDGNMWVATATGLDRFSDPTAAIYSSREGLSGDLVTSVYADGAGNVWAGTSGAGLTRFYANPEGLVVSSRELPGATVLSVLEDHSGNLWIGTTNGFVRQSKDSLAPVLGPDDESFDRVFAIESLGNEIWFIDAKRGLFRIPNGKGSPQPAMLADTRAAYRLLTDHFGRLWIGSYRGGVTILDHGMPKTYPEKDGLAGGAVQALAEDTSGTVWVGTTGGLSRFRNGQLTTWNEPNWLDAGGVQAIIADDFGGLWIIIGRELLQIPLSELDRSPPGANGASLTNATHFGPADGLEISRRGGISSPRITKSADGRIWIASEVGVAVINPARPNWRMPVPATIEEIALGGQPLPLQHPKVNLGNKGLTISFVGTNLSYPERIHYRYQLEGIDRNWTDLKTTRAVTFRNLKDGNYRFCVMATIDGSWHGGKTCESFSVLPRFYETWPFLIACLVSPGPLIYGLYHWKVTQIRGRLGLVMQERLRLARELHDTLLQGVAGALYQLEAARKQLHRDPEESEKVLTRAIEQVDSSLHEARMAISEMRVSAVETNELYDAIVSMGRSIAEGAACRFKHTVHGSPRKLPSHVEAGIFVLVREALTNAAKHSGAREIRFDLSFVRSKVEVVVADDGKGFNLQEALAMNGHWGLRGLSERAGLMGADLKIDSSVGQGTRVVLSLRKGTLF